MRDSLATRERILAAIADIGEGIEISLENPRMYGPTIGYYLALVSGHYTLGDPPAVCLAPAARLAERLAQSLRYTDYALDFRIDPPTFLEGIAAVYLAGSAETLFQVFARCSWPDTLEPWLHAYFDLICRAFGGRAPGRDTLPSAPPPPPRELMPIAELMQVLVENDREAFAPALPRYLTKTWGPIAERAAKSSLKSQWNIYTGRWSFLAAAACRKMGSIPELPPKAQVYFPRELV